MIRTYDDDGYAFDPVALYNMDEDPYQTRNLAEEQADLLAQMDHHLAEWLHEQSVKPYAIPDPMQVVLRERQAKG